ncbi:hypothetical protein JRO89_XS01G0159300 [Xanthoceras sorbifolium]|uniref:Uncharacterized protein n=1 Tax=Xanthoceras sorbifolium TaxID=99658 RepID=A0ABQ8IKZ5_9ROSI|nr:hypothetical protein JRO89_XS01G0159300 [Xanthoceras sorbifolium]
MIVCFPQTVVSVCIVAKFGVDGNPGELPEWYAIVVVLFICIYVIGFSWSWGPLGWLVPSEIFPLEIRLAGQSINISVNMFFTFVMLKQRVSQLRRWAKYGRTTTTGPDSSAKTTLLPMEGLRWAKVAMLQKS